MTSLSKLLREYHPAKRIVITAVLLVLVAICLLIDWLVVIGFDHFSCQWGIVGDMLGVMVLIVAILLLYFFTLLGVSLAMLAIPVWFIQIDDIWATAS